MTKNNSCLIIGLDGATWKVLDPLIKKSKIPFIASLKSQGAFGILESTIPPITASVWTSFQTGANPGKHGVFGFLNHRKNFQNPPLVNSKMIRLKKIWEVLGEYGHKSLIINLPVTFPVSKINGVMVSSFLTPSKTTRIYPPSLEKVLKHENYEVDLFAKDAIGGLPHEKLLLVKKKYYLRRLLEVSEKRINVFKKLFELDDFSLSFVLFKETDIAQHLFWGDRLLDQYYIKLDKQLKNLYEYFVKRTSINCSVLVVSDHGFHAASKYEFSPYAWFLNQGYISSGNNKNVWNFLRKLNKNLKTYGINLSNFKLVGKARKNVINKIEAQDRYMHNKKGVIATIEGLYFTKKYSTKRLLEIRDKLRNLTLRNKRVFKIVELSKDVYSGTHVVDGPDIVWVTNEKFSINTSHLAQDIFNKRITHIKGDHVSDGEGIFMAVGDYFDKSKNKRLKIYDIFPLICYVLGISVPATIDGRVPFSILQKKQKKMNKSEKRRVENQVSREIDNLKY